MQIMRAFVPRTADLDQTMVDLGTERRHGDRVADVEVLVGGRSRVGVDQRITDPRTATAPPRKNSAPSGRSGRLGPTRAAPCASKQRGRATGGHLPGRATMKGHVAITPILGSSRVVCRRNDGACVVAGGRSSRAPSLTARCRTSGARVGVAARRARLAATAAPSPTLMRALPVLATPGTAVDDLAGRNCGGMAGVFYADETDQRDRRVSR
jgi:hypothetical protein